MANQRIDVRHCSQKTDYEYVAVDVGGHTILISEREGDPNLHIPDHATIRVHGDQKDGVTVVVGKDEFPTNIKALSEREFYERYNDE